MSFPAGLALCPNDGERLLAPAPPDPTGSIRGSQPMERTESLAIGSGTGSLADEISPDDLTRAERPSARGPTASTRSPRRRRRRPATRRPEERIGEVLGNYKILDLLGRGGMGCVYLAEHIKLGRQVALKLLRDDHASRRDAVARFFQEARSVNRIRHRNIVDVTDFVELDDGSSFLVMELLHGQSLSRLLRKERLDGPRALALLIQICDGLSAAHGMGIVHRDLKPDNIFVVPTSDGAELVKLLDFGVAKLLWRDEDEDEEYGFETAAGAVVGTPTYMSPEQAGGLTIDARSDIYSLGAIMYEIFTGRPLFRGKSFGEFVRKHLSEQPVPPSQASGGAVDERLEEIILRCLQKRAEDRYPDIGALRDDLMQLLGAIETSLPETGFTQTLDSAELMPVTTSPPPASVATANRSGLGAPQLESSPYTVARSTAGYASHAGSAEPAPPTPPPWPAETGMAMGDLPGVRTRPGEPKSRAGLWIGLAIAGAAAGAALFIAITRAGGESETGERQVASQSASGPVVSAVPGSSDDEAPERSGPDDPGAAAFTVRFLSSPRAKVYAVGNDTPLCATPCDVTVDPDAPGPAAHRDFVVDRAGYHRREVRIDLADPQRTVNAQLRRIRRRDPDRRPDRKVADPPVPDETPVADKRDPPVVKEDPVEPPEPKAPPPSGPIDPSHTLDPFGKP